MQEVYEEPRAKGQGVHEIRIECQQRLFWEHLQLHHQQVVKYLKEVFFKFYYVLDFYAHYCLKGG